jgi:predicted kinase
MNQWLQQLCHFATPSIDECVQQLGPVIPWLNDLRKTPQDPGWHAEGNVHIHTGMVLEELYQLLAKEAAYLSGQQRQSLILAAIFHDIGKTRNTRKMTIRGQQRIGSPDHEAKGRSYLAFQLMKLPLPISVIWTVLGLVGEHQMPKMLVVQNMDHGAYIALSRRADLALLYWLERADMQGRIGEAIPQQLQYLEQYREHCQAYALWHQPFVSEELDRLIAHETSSTQNYLRPLVIDMLQRGTSTSFKSAIAKLSRHKDEHAHLILLCGPSGIGKSRYVAHHCHDMSLISLDAIREELWGDRACQDNPQEVVAIAQQRLKQYLREKRTVVWDATNLRQDYRKPLYAMARDQHALITLVIFLAPENAIYNGNTNRAYAVPKAVVTAQIAKYQFPRISDVHHVVVVDGEGHPHQHTR